MSIHNLSRSRLRKIELIAPSTTTNPNSTAHRGGIRSSTFSMTSTGGAMFTTLNSDTAPHCYDDVEHSVATNQCSSSSGKDGETHIDGPFNELRAYLLSDDTRLPVHPLFTTIAAAPEDYDTYVGEDDWNNTRKQKEHTNMSSTSTDNQEDRVPPPPPSGPCVRYLVDWMLKALHESRTGGVVLCGARCCASDCDWAVSTRETVLQTPRDIMMAMRMSSKFLNDLEWQADESFHSRQHTSSSSSSQAASTSATTVDNDTASAGSDSASSIILCFSLEEAIPVSAANLFRLFYAIDDMSSLDTLQEGDVRCVASQKVTDVCFPDLAIWTLQQERDALQVMRSRIGGVASSASTHTTNNNKTHWKAAISDILQSTHNDSLVRSLRSANGVLPPTTSSGSLPRMVIAFDVVYESSRLPVFVTSAHVWIPKEDAEGRRTQQQQQQQLHEEQEESTSDDEDAFFCLFRNADALAAVVSQHYDHHHPPHSTDASANETRTLFVAHDLSELRPSASRSSEFCGGGGGCGASDDWSAIRHQQVAGGVHIPDVVLKMMMAASGGAS